MAEEKKETKKLKKEELAATRFLQARLKAQRAKEVAQLEVDNLKELRKKRQQKLREAEQALESFKNDDILLALAGMDKVRDEAKYQKEAAECLFDLLAKFRKADDQKQQKSDKPSLQEMCDKLNPADQLFKIIEKATVYKETDKTLIIDGKCIYSLVCECVNKQNQRLEDAKAKLLELEEVAKAELDKKEAAKDVAAKERAKAKSKNTTANDSTVVDEKAE